MQLSPFNRAEYNFIRPVEAVEYWTAATDAYKKMNEVRAEKEAIATGIESRRGRQMNEMLEMFAGLYEAQKGGYRGVKLSGLMMEIDRLQRHPQPDRARLSELYRSVLFLYTELDVEAFKAEWTEMFGGEDLSKQISKLDGRAGGLTKKLIDAQAKLPGCFVAEVPRAFRGLRLSETADDKAVAEHSEKIVGLFIADWRSRAPMFTMPVTASGVAISSMATATAEEWLLAYEALGLPVVKGKRPKYRPIVSDGRRREELQKKADSEQQAVMS